MLFITIIIISAYICYKDITERRIPNAAQYLILLIGFVYLSVHGISPTDWSSLSIPAGVILVGALISRINIIGFGDVKLIFSTLLLVNPEHYYDVLMFIVFAGGIWSVIWQYFLSGLSLIKKIDRVGVGIPYGIPIVVGLCLFTFVS